MGESKIIRRGGGGIDVSDATAVQSDVLQGKTFYAGDENIKTGTIPSKSAETFTPGTTNQTIAAGQYLSGTQTIQGSANLVASNIRSGTTIFNVTGTLQEADFAQGTFYNNAVVANVGASQSFIVSSSGWTTWVFSIPSNATKINVLGRHSFCAFSSTNISTTSNSYTKVDVGPDISFYGGSQPDPLYATNGGYFIPNNAISVTISGAPSGNQFWPVQENVQNLKVTFE